MDQLISDEEKQYKQLISILPKAKGWMLSSQNQYQGFWYHPSTIRGILIAQKQRYYSTNPQLKSSSSTRVLLASYPKSGATWVKSLLFALTTRADHHVSTGCTNYSTDHPLLTSNSHECIPFIEHYAHNNPSNPVPENSSLLATHIPYQSLPDSIKSSNCRIVYVYRDPKDVLISLWHFCNEYLRSISEKTLPMEEAVDLFCQGKSIFGPYWDHAKGYYRDKSSNSSETSVVWVSYEELKSDPVRYLTRLASFIRKPFSTEEEIAGVPESIVNLCSFDKQRDLEVNQSQSVNKAMPNIMKMTNNLFFRKGVVGDHRNYLTDEMIQRIDNITIQTFGDVGPFTSRWLLTD